MNEFDFNGFSLMVCFSLIEIMLEFVSFTTVISSSLLKLSPGNSLPKILSGDEKD